MTTEPETLSLELLTPQLQRRIARLLLQHDRRAFRGRFREFYAQSQQPIPAALQAYDALTRLIGLADELFDDILPRIHRQLSFSATRLDLDEEPPLRGQIDWRRTIDRHVAERPDQPPTRFVTSMRNRSFATSENRMVVAILLRYGQHLGRMRGSALFADAPLNAAEQRELSQIEDRVRRELATPHFQEIARDLNAGDVSELVEQASGKLRSGSNPYADIIAWWQRVERQHIQVRQHKQHGPVLQAPEQAGLLYQLWIALELVHMLAEKNVLRETQIATDQLRFTFTWKDRSFTLVYDRSPKQHLAWENGPGERPDYFITRAQPLVVEYGGSVIWQEPGVLLDAKCYLGSSASRASGAIKRLLADIQLLDAQHGALIFPDITDLPQKITPIPDRYLGAVPPQNAVHLYAMRPLGAEEALHNTLAALLSQVSAWLPDRPVIACHGSIPDIDTITAHGTRAAATPTIFCPKPHIRPDRVDMVDPIHDCLKNPQMCHVMTNSAVETLIAPYVQRVLTDDDLKNAIDTLRQRLQAKIDPADDSPEAEIARTVLINAIGRLVDDYTKHNAKSTGPIESHLKGLFAQYWSDTIHPRGLPHTVQSMLISGEFVYYELEQSNVKDWAACAVQYVRAMEYELKHRLYTNIGGAAHLRSKNNQPLQPHFFTFGTVTSAYQYRPNDYNWQKFIQRGVTASKSSESDFTAVMAQMDILRPLRNDIAHSVSISRTQAETVRDIVLYNPHDPMFAPRALRRFVEMLD